MVLLLAESPPPLCTLLIRFGLKNRCRTRLRASKSSEECQCDITNVTECYPPIRLSPRRRNMKVAALAAFGVLLIAFSAGAAQRQFISPATTYDNDGHCKTASADAALAVHRIRPKPQKTIANVVQPLLQPPPSQTDSQLQQ